MTGKGAPMTAPSPAARAKELAEFLRRQPLGPHRNYAEAADLLDAFAAQETRTCETKPRRCNCIGPRTEAVASEYLCRRCGYFYSDVDNLAAWTPKEDA